jgi:hypothetical protein
MSREWPGRQAVHLQQQKGVYKERKEKMGRSTTIIPIIFPIIHIISIVCAGLRWL